MSKIDSSTPRDRAGRRLVALASALGITASMMLSSAASPVTAAPPDRVGVATAAAVASTATVAPSSVALFAPVTVDLCATTGTTTMPNGATVPVWGYAPGDCSGGPTVATTGGPTLIVDVGDVVTINLHNSLTVDTGLLLHGQEMAPDTTGTPGGGVTTYVFTATNPGTYLYEAGLLPGAQYQTAMGLHGALIVRPATAGQAYDDASTAYDDEAVLVLSEIDTALNGSVDPASFDMRNYKPRYSLINGAAFPDTAPIPVAAAGNRVLLRYLNAGVDYHSMALLGLHQAVIANDGSPLTFPHSIVAETFGPGQTTDAIATVPAAAADGSNFALYDANLMLRNSNASGFGGMMTFLSLPGGGPGPDTVGPITSGVTLTPNAGDVDVTATVDDASTGASDVSAAEYFIDTLGPNGTGEAMTGAFSSPTEVVSGTITAATLAGLTAGDHLVYVRGQDDAGNWGAANSAVLSLGSGPATTQLALDPNPTNGSANVALTGTADDTASGNDIITAAEYFIDVAGADGSGAPMTVSSNAPVSGLHATISAATVAGLPEGAHPLFVHSQDATGSWGPLTQIDLVVDVTAPTTSNVSAAPNPNNGSQPFNESIPAVRVSASFADLGAGTCPLQPCARAEGFIDTVGADGTGFVFAATDGLFDTNSENGYSDVPLATIGLLSAGPHTIYVHARDTTGNWGPTSTTVLVIDKGAPVVSGVTAAPNPTGGDTSVTLSASATDSASAVDAAEWFTGTDPGTGNGMAMTVGGTGPWALSTTIDVTTWANGNYTLRVRARDAAGNWSATSSTVLSVDEPVAAVILYFSTAGNFAVPGVSGPFDDSDIYSWNGTSFARVFDAAGPGSAGLPGGADIDALLVVDADTMYVSFNNNGGVNLPGPLTAANAQDEDILLYDAGTWSVFFDGSDVGLGNGGNAEDVDAFHILGTGSVVISTLGNGNVPGIGGFNDEDLLNCVGALGSATNCTWSVYFDGSDVALGAGSEDVDGVSVSAGGIHLTTTGNFSVAGLTGQGVDVFACNSPVTGTATACGSFAMVFDGSANGITNNLDAIDLP